MKTNYVVAIVAVLALPVSALAGIGGPAPHWVDNMPAGATDSFPYSGLLSLDTNLDCLTDTTALLFGPGSIKRSGSLDDSNQYPGTRPIDGHPDVVDTEIMAMNLTGGGVTLRIGGGLGTFPLARSLGNFAEQPGNPALADSFFDVFFEIDLGGGNRLYNQTPIRNQNTIDQWPSSTPCVGPLGSCIPLYTSPTPGQGVHVANLTSPFSFSQGVPEPSSICLCGLALAVVMLRRHRR